MLDTIPDAFAKSKEGHVVGKLVVNVTAQVYAAPEKYDLVVYGSSPAGIAAAVAGGEAWPQSGIVRASANDWWHGAAGNLALNDTVTVLSILGLLWSLQRKMHATMVFQRDRSLLIPQILCQPRQNIPQNAVRGSCHGHLSWLQADGRNDNHSHGRIGYS